MWNVTRRRREEATARVTRMELENYRRWDEEIQHLKEQIEDLQDGGIKSPRVTGMPKATSKAGDQIGNRVARLSTLEGMINDLKVRQARIRDAIGRLKPIEMRIIWFRYIDGLPWERIAEKMQYSQRFIRQIHDRAVRSLEEMGPGPQNRCS